MDTINTKNWQIRNFLAILLTLLIVVATLVVAWHSLKTCNDLSFIGQTLLPLWATWVGTILAFYFSRENFEAASKSYQEVIKRLGPEEKMASIPVASAMIPLSKIAYLTWSEAKIEKLFSILDNPAFADFNRYAILDDKHVLVSMVHKSMIHRFIADKVREGQASSEIESYTLETFLNTASDEIKTTLNRGYTFVPKTANLLQAKKALESIKECNDVFVTATGNKAEPIEGLITNNKLLELSSL